MLCEDVYSTNANDYDIILSHHFVYNTLLLDKGDLIQMWMTYFSRIFYRLFHLNLYVVYWTKGKKKYLILEMTSWSLAFCENKRCVSVCIIVHAFETKIKFLGIGHYLWPGWEPKRKYLEATKIFWLNLL